MKKTLKKEQVDLLKFEKQLLGLGAGLGALGAGAAAGAEEAVGDVASTHLAQVQAAYLDLVQAVQTAHNAVEESAIEAGVTLLRADGTPKIDPLVEVAKSLLGTG